MKIKTIQTSTGENVYVIDDVFRAHQLVSFNKFFINSYFMLKGKSDDTLDTQANIFFMARYNETDEQNLGFFETPEFIEIQNKFLQGLTFSRTSWVNCSTHLTPYISHVDESKNVLAKTVIFYANLKWGSDWGGETLIANNLGETELAIEFRPNRILVFDSVLLHRACPITLESKSYYRLTYTKQFNISVESEQIND